MHGGGGKLLQLVWFPPNCLSLLTKPNSKVANNMISSVFMSVNIIHKTFT